MREIKTSKVEGISFHARRPWILASLNSGGIELWDYHVERLIHTFDKHEGPVRGVHIHRELPDMFVSGGDDYKVCVWNCHTRKLLFTLLGHHGCIRTVQFHHELPWVMSASNDWTIRIWNWQSRTCVSVLTGHTDLVMCASFSPKHDLIVSASLDTTLRVWDINRTPYSVGVNLKYVLTDHLGGVNWASFHPSQALMVSGANDSIVKLWSLGETHAVMLQTLEGHRDSVLSLLFYPKREKTIISLSEDKRITVWDTNNQGTRIRTFSREHDSFWTLAVHPENNLLAAGHDSGLIFFKLERERPAFHVKGDSLLYAKDSTVWLYHFSKQTKAAKYSSILHTSEHYNPGLSWNQSVRALSHSRIHAVLVSSDVNGGSYELCLVQNDQHLRQTHGKVSALLVSDSTYVVLQKGTKQVAVRKIWENSEHMLTLPNITHAIFYGGDKKILCISEDKVAIFDLQQSIVLCERQTPSVVKDVVWSKDMERVALLSKHTIIIASKDLVPQCTLHDTNRVKSGVWDDEHGVFIYTTLNHIKFCLPNGESGIIRTLGVPMYVTKVDGDKVFCLDREVKIRIIDIAASVAEYAFKAFRF